MNNFTCRVVRFFLVWLLLAGAGSAWSQTYTQYVPQGVGNRFQTPHAACAYLINTMQGIGGSVTATASTGYHVCRDGSGIYRGEATNQTITLSCTGTAVPTFVTTTGWACVAPTTPSPTPTPGAIQCSAACTVTLVHQFDLPLFQLSVQEAQQLALAILACWAVAWGIRQVARLLRDTGSDDVQKET